MKNLEKTSRLSLFHLVQTQGCDRWLNHSLHKDSQFHIQQGRGTIYCAPTFSRVNSLWREKNYPGRSALDKSVEDRAVKLLARDKVNLVPLTPDS